jgi:hypothetical protein
VSPRFRDLDLHGTSGINQDPAPRRWFSVDIEAQAEDFAIRG